MVGRFDWYGVSFVMRWTCFGRFETRGCGNGEEVSGAWGVGYELYLDWFFI